MRTSGLLCLALVTSLLVVQLQAVDAAKAGHAAVRDEDDDADISVPAPAPADAGDKNSAGSDGEVTDEAPESAQDDDEEASDDDSEDQAADNSADDDNKDGQDSSSSETSDDAFAADHATPEEEADALQNFEVICTTCGDDSEEEISSDIMDFDDFEDHGEPMFSKSNLTGVWKTCAEETGSLTADNCYVESQYSDTISFKFYLGFSNVYKLKNTSVTASGGDAHPQVTAVYLDNDLDGAIQIRYNCASSKNQVSVITFNFLVTKSHSVTFRWLKVCGGGKNDKVELGYKTEDEEKKNVPFTDSTDLVVPPYDPSTNIYIKLKKPAKLQTYEAPIVTTDTDLVNATVRGFGAKGLELRLFNSEFTVNYECHGEVTANIKLQVGLPPFDPLVATWKKECSGAEEETTAVNASAPLDIGVSSGVYNVMKDGKAVENFRYEFDSETDGSELYRFPENVHAVTFYLRNTRDDGIPLNIHAAAVTVRDRGVLYADAQFVSTDVLPGKEMRLPVRLVCLREGVSSALVTLSTVKYGNVEFDR
mmetsp:Transcript_975/g.3042  ORF Transcript_975/g.3042 Transcript_975/m.3042 type:complete len:536 (-) Transcript_975:6-1613(-)